MSMRKEAIKSSLLSLVTKPILFTEGKQTQSQITVHGSWVASFLWLNFLKWGCSWWLNRQVSIEEGDTKARELGALFIETSAKAGFNIKVNKHTRQWWCILLSKTLTSFSFCFEWSLCSVRLRRPYRGLRQLHGGDKRIWWMWT